MRLIFWLLDLNQETFDGESSIWLWGITHEGKRVLIIDNNYAAYFYLLPKLDQDPNELKRRLEVDKPHPSIENVTVEKKRLLSEEREVLKIVCSDPAAVERAARDSLRKLGAEATYEERLRQAIKYQNDYGIKPCQWYEIDTERSSIDPAQYSVEETLTATNHPIAIPREEPPKLSVLAFSPLAISKTGAPSAIRDPIRIISTTTTGQRAEVLQTQAESDAEIIQQFGNTVSKINPDFVLSFEGNTAEWPYLAKRADRAKTPLKIGRDGGPPHQSLYGHYSLIGRANIDLLNFAEDIYDVKIKDVANTAKHLGIEISKNKPIDDTNFFAYWSKQDLRKELILQVQEETETIFKIGQEAIDYVIQLSALCGLPPDQVIAAATGFRVDNYLMMETHALGQLIPSRLEKSIIPYKGAIVLEPKVGLYDRV